MSKNFHFICVGKESVKLHIAGLPKFRADETVLFTGKRNVKTQQIIENLEEMGVAYRIIFIRPGYLDSYVKANDEATVSFTDDSCVAINTSTGSKIMVGAIEDAVRIQLYSFHKRVNEASASAFRYIIKFKSGKRLRFEIAPIWNSHAFLHNDIFEILVEADQPITLDQIYRALVDRLGDEAPGWEAFRKIFREFKRWFKNLPCYVEKLERSPCYKIKLEL